MRFIIPILAFILLLFAAPAAAQFPEDCTSGNYAVAFAMIGDTLPQVSQANLDRTLAALVAVIQNQRAQCADLFFEGDTGRIIGPMILPAGTWILEGTFSTIGRADLTLLDQECRADFIGASLMSVRVGPAVDQSVIQTSQDCELLVEIATSDEWTLAFQPIR